MMGDEHIPTRFQAICEMCGRILDIRAEGVHQRTSGWVKNRNGGGGHGISLPEREHRFAHGYCVDRISKGYAKQNEMFG